MFFYLLILLNYSILIIAKENSNTKSKLLIYNYYDKLIDLKDSNIINIFNNYLIKEENLFWNNETQNNKTRIFVEYIFYEYYGLSFCVLFIGFYILFFGAYYYKIGIIFHSAMFIYYNFVFLLDMNCEYSKESQYNYYLYILFFSFISGIFCRIYLDADERKSCQLILYGACFGYFLFKSIIYYFILLKKIYRNNIILVTLFVSSIVFGSLFNLYIPLGDYAFLPCSVMCGSYYIIISFTHILGSKYTDFNILDLAPNLEIEENEFITYIIAQLILISFSIYIQIIHLKEKVFEDPQVIQIKALNEFISESRLSFNEDDDNAIIQERDNKENLIENFNLNEDINDNDEVIIEKED